MCGSQERIWNLCLYGCTQEDILKLLEEGVNKILKPSWYF